MSKIDTQQADVSLFGASSVPIITQRVVRVGMALALLVSSVLIYSLIRAVDHQSLNDQNITGLIVVNAIVAVILLLSIALMAWRLRQQLVQKRFGSRLLAKLAAIFALVGLVPGLLIYSVSYQFVSRSIESWFDVRVEKALEAGINLGRETLDGLTNDWSKKARSAASNLSFVTGVSLSLNLDKQRDLLGADDAVVWSQSGQLLASSGTVRFELAPEKPSLQQMRSLKTQSAVTVFEGLDEGKKTPKLKVLVPIVASGLALSGELRYLVLTQKLPTNLVTNALAVQGAYNEYQERALAKEGLKKMYIVTLTLSLFLAVLGAFILAVLLGNQLVRPLLILAFGVDRVSAGDLSPKLVLHENNELAGLTQAFARMTQQLADARVIEQKAQRVQAWNDVAQRVAHEIKNPLTPIQLSAERLGKKLINKLDETDKLLLEKSVKTIVDQVDAMKRLVNEFRDYGRLPNAQLTALDLKDVLLETLHLYDHELQTGVIALDFNSVQDASVQGDKQQLRQVVHNVVQNALDSARAAQNGQQTAHVSIQLQLDAQQRMCCAISDNGGGFAPQILAHAFEPYNTTKAKGTGLGLALVRKIMHEHHGDVSIENRQGGACVRLLFPLMKRSVDH